MPAPMGLGLTMIRIWSSLSLRQHNRNEINKTVHKNEQNDELVVNTILEHDYW